MAKITVIFLIYNDAQYVPGLVDAILKQRHPNHRDASEWLDVLFMDNGSRDGTDQAIREALARAGSPSHIKLEVNAQNMGISGALNKAFQMVKTPFALTCHCDVLFGRPDYVGKMLEHLEKNPRAAMITGQPTIPAKPGGLPFSEKVNLIANLMDIFPAGRSAASVGSDDDELVPVGFAESRCDGFRVEALKAVGYYNTTLRLAGEDQIMAAQLREAGYEVYQAPKLPYYLSVSSDQDSLYKLVKHQRLFGRAHPYILLKHRNTLAGVAGSLAGSNRQIRSMLRVSQVFSTFVYLWSALQFFSHAGFGSWVLPLILVFFVKLAVFARHFSAIPLTFSEFVAFFALQPVLDISYAVGLVQGLWQLRRESIS
ncbi:MAG: glycosyltransferase family 2 protein [Bacteriovoracia bacterium]